MDDKDKRASCEAILREYGFKLCQISLHGKMVRIQSPAQDFNQFSDATLRERIVQSLKRLGFVFVGLDLKSIAIPPSGDLDPP